MFFIRKRKLKKILNNRIREAEEMKHRSLNKENEAWWLGQRDAYQNVLGWLGGQNGTN